MREWPTLKFFAYQHLPKHLQDISQPFHDLAYSLVQRENLENAQELSKALDKLLEAKDAAVRAFLWG